MWRMFAECISGLATLLVGRINRPGLFRYYDGTRWRYADPFRVWRALCHHPKMDMATHLPLADAGQEPETTMTIEALAEIFRVARYDPATGQGLTDWEILDLLRDFEQYLQQLKKNINPSRMPLLLSALASSDARAARDPTENCGSASFSTPAGSTPAAPSGS